MPAIPYSSIHYADKLFIDGLSRSEKRKRLRVWYRDFVECDFRLAEVHDGDVVFFRSLVRDDYQESFHAVVLASGIANPVVIENYKIRLNPPKINTAASRFMIKNHSLWDRIDESDQLTRTILFIRACMYAFIRDHFGDVRPQAVIFHADMQPTEHLLALHFRQMGVPTVTLQHGLYVDYGDYDTVNKINYMHQPSEYFLSWGPETSELIGRYHPETRIVECGKPLIFNASPPAGTAASAPYVSLFLDQKPFQAQNIEMIEIVLAYAQLKGMEVKVRFHPSLPKAEILKRYPGMTEQLHFTDAALIVGHTSSLLYEALALGCRVMRFATDIPAIPLPDNSQFSTLHELEQKLTLAQDKDLWRRYFTALGEDALQNYRTFFDGLLNSRKVMTA
ncbi:hypothetical protein [Pseudotabrizicola alkalilacus]|nr:hypothetical protein [Pseudotabrizicola alkalilacus]